MAVVIPNVWISAWRLRLRNMWPALAHGRSWFFWIQTKQQHPMLSVFLHLASLARPCFGCGEGGMGPASVAHAAKSHACLVFWESSSRYMRPFEIPSFLIYCSPLLGNPLRSSARILHSLAFLLFNSWHRRKSPKRLCFSSCSSCRSKLVGCGECWWSSSWNLIGSGWRAFFSQRARSPELHGMPNVKFIVIIEASFIVESPLQPIALHGPNLTRTPFSKSRQMICAQKISIICTHASQFTGSFTWQSENFHNLIQVKRNIKLFHGKHTVQEPLSNVNPTTCR